MIPVYVNVFNRLTTTRSLCHQLELRGAEVIIVDNNSDYPPLLDWYDSCKYDVVRLRENLGHHAPWLSGVIRQDEPEIYGVTDCDLDISEVPNDLLTHLKQPLFWDIPVVKAGVSLRISDLPVWQTQVKWWERRFWRQQRRPGWYKAAIDTTLALYLGTTDQKSATSTFEVSCVRAAPPYCARHVPWYLDAENLDEENQHYFKTASASASWRPKGKRLESKPLSQVKLLKKAQ